MPVTFLANGRRVITKADNAPITTQIEEKEKKPPVKRKKRKLKNKL